MVDNSSKPNWALRQSEECTRVYKEDSPEYQEGIESLHLRYDFSFLNSKLEIKASAKATYEAKKLGLEWQVVKLFLYDLSDGLKDASVMTQQNIDQFAVKTIKNKKPYRESNEAKDHYMFDIGSDFGGKAMLVVVFIEAQGRPNHVYPFLFGSTMNNLPIIHFGVAFGSQGVIQSSIIRSRGNFLVVDEFATVRRPDGKFVLAYDVNKGREITGDELTGLALLSFFSLIEQRISGEAGLVEYGKNYLKKMFDDMEKENRARALEGKPPKLSQQVWYSSLDMVLIPYLRFTVDNLAPDPRASYIEADNQFQIMIDPEKTPLERIGGAIGFLSYGAMTVLDCVPGAETLTKLGLKQTEVQIKNPIKGLLRKGSKGGPDVTSAGHIGSGIAKPANSADKTMEKAIVLRDIDDVEKFSSQAAAKLEREADEIINGLRNAKLSNPKNAELLKKVEEKLERIKKATNEIRRSLKALPEMKPTEKLRLFHLAQANLDFAYLLRVSEKKGHFLELNELIKLTRNERWTPKRRGAAIVAWEEAQRMRGKEIPKMTFADKVRDFAQRSRKNGKAVFEDSWHFNLNQEGFQKLITKLKRGLKKIGSNVVLVKEDIDRFKDASKKAYLEFVGKCKQGPPHGLPKEYLEHVKGLEFCGKSSGAISEAVAKLNDIDANIIPPMSKIAESERAMAMEARKEYFKMLNNKYKAMDPKGLELADKNIFVYAEFGNGALNKIDEGWPPELEKVYDKIERKAALLFDETGNLLPETLKINNEQLALGELTKEELRLFSEEGLKLFVKTENPKWLEKLEWALESTYGDAKKMLSKEEMELIKSAGEAMRGRTAEKIVSFEEAKNLLRRFAGDVEAPILDERHMFVFKNREEAEKACDFMRQSRPPPGARPLQLPQSKKEEIQIAISYVQPVVGSKSQPDHKTIELFAEMLMTPDDVLFSSGLIIP